MTRNLALGLGAAGVVVVTVAAVLLLGGDPPAPPPPIPGKTTEAPRGPPPGTEPAVTELPPSTNTSTGTSTSTATSERPPTGTGAALLAQVREIVARGERAADDAGERAAAGDLAKVLADLAARGDAAVDDARALLEPSAPPGVQEVGARVLGSIGTQRALEALSAFACTRGPVPPRLQALRGLKASSLPFARGALLDVALDANADPETRAYALDLMRDVVGAEEALYQLATKTTELPEVRAAALDALLTLEPARGREALKEVGGDPELAPYLEGLRDR